MECTLAQLSGSGYLFLEYKCRVPGRMTQHSLVSTDEGWVTAAEMMLSVPGDECVLGCTQQHTGLDSCHGVKVLLGALRVLLLLLAYIY